jgi:hypothetical protein
MKYTIRLQQGLGMFGALSPLSHATLQVIGTVDVTAILLWHNLCITAE